MGTKSILPAQEIENLKNTQALTLGGYFSTSQVYTQEPSDSSSQSVYNGFYTGSINIYLHDIKMQRTWMFHYKRYNNGYALKSPKTLIFIFSTPSPLKGKAKNHHFTKVPFRGLFAGVYETAAQSSGIKWLFGLDSETINQFKYEQYAKISTDFKFLFNPIGMRKGNNT